MQSGGAAVIQAGQDEVAGRTMRFVSPNPRRTPQSSDSELDDRRKRHKSKHVPAAAEPDYISDQEARILRHNDSGSTRASQWYVDVQKDTGVSQQEHLGLDNERPYFIGSGSGEQYNPSLLRTSNSVAGFGTAAKDSENDDLRGIIDDLTLENRKLRQTLKAARQLHLNSVGDQDHTQDKLFEVRLHGLPPKKRRELEYLLKNFAASIHSTSPKPRSSNTNTSDGSKTTEKTKVPTDSGYGSIAALSNTGLTPSIRDTNAVRHGHARRHSAVKSYLHDMPDSLLPRKNPFMTERSKMALVVRRLEQLFTGRKAGPGAHQHPIQQQEVSQSAARADLAQDHRKKRPEGKRESKIMAPDTRINLDIPEQNTTGQNVRGTELNHESQLSGSGTPEQRPTRPLDLDIHRAQIAVDNMQYLKHLGLSSAGNVVTSNREDGDWVFLNLLMGMAQLHTINVTPDLVKKAITKFSKHFELSKDGTKVRWIGSLTDTRFTQEEEKAIEQAEYIEHDQLDDTGTISGSRRSKTNGGSIVAMRSNSFSEDKTSGQITTNDSSVPQTRSTNSHTQPTSLTRQTSTSTNFDYKPIVFRGRHKSALFAQSSDASRESSSGDSDAVAHILSRSNLHQKSKDKGLITFYNNPFWCSDFSADNAPSNMKPARSAIRGECLGLSVPCEDFESPIRSASATYFTPEFAAKPYQAQLEDDQSQLDIFPVTAQSLDLTLDHEIYPMAFEACGLGGTMPADNFAVDVSILRSLTYCTNTKPSSCQLHSKYHYSTISTNLIPLLPSKLPVPSYTFFTSSSSSALSLNSCLSSSTMSKSLSGSSSLIDETNPAPPVFLTQFSHSSGDASADTDDRDRDAYMRLHQQNTGSGESSEEIDMLAHARRTDPAAVAEQERAYMINEPGGSKVAASLAATVGASRDGSVVDALSYSGDRALSEGSQGARETRTKPRIITTIDR